MSRLPLWAYGAQWPRGASEKPYGTQPQNCLTKRGKAGVFVHELPAPLLETHPGVVEYLTLTGCRISGLTKLMGAEEAFGKKTEIKMFEVESLQYIWELSTTAIGKFNDSEQGVEHSKHLLQIMS